MKVSYIDLTQEQIDRNVSITYKYSNSDTVTEVRHDISEQDKDALMKRANYLSKTATELVIGLNNG